MLLKNLRLIDLAGLLWKFLLELETLLDSVSRELVFEQNLLEAVLRCDLVLFHNPNGHTDDVVMDEFLPVDGAYVTHEFFLFLLWHQRQYWIDILILVVPIAFHKEIEDFDHTVQLDQHGVHLLGLFLHRGRANNRKFRGCKICLSWPVLSKVFHSLNVQFILWELCVAAINSLVQLNVSEVLNRELNIF